MIVNKLDELEPVYFSGLNGIRPIAALAVFFWHIDQFSYLFNIQK
jgi:peptidoglycan/LPS O-acetylase OafA/YrhL